MQLSGQFLPWAEPVEVADCSEEPAAADVDRVAHHLEPVGGVVEELEAAVDALGGEEEHVVAGAHR
jgi:hypothetical protein